MRNLSSIDYENLCLSLLHSESEDEIIRHLKKYKFWDNSDHWRPFGDNENNWSSVGNQQGNPAAAMVEKLVNSIDAVLIRECLLRGIHPESNQAPNSIPDALDQFFGIKNGNLANISQAQRAKLASNIGFVATGRKTIPNYTVFDRGEGQTPQKMPDTLLSLSKSNKLRIPFVQGKFNMGGTGVLPFCGKNNFQLIISRRHPQIADSSDRTAQFWGFTIVRREDPEYGYGRRSSMFTYLAPERTIPMFKAGKIQIPESGDGPELPFIEWGTIIKMFEYEMTGMKSNILFDPFNAFALLLPKPGLPIHFYEKRGYEWGPGKPRVMPGLLTRLQENKTDDVENGFPTSHQFSVRGEAMNADVYVFRKEKEENKSEDRAQKYRKTEGIIFTVNGQTHGVIPQKFFGGHRVNMGYLAESLLIIVDATEIGTRSREDLFMNSRDRMRRGELYYEIEDALIELISNHQGLKELRERRRREAIDNRLSDSKPLQELLEDILKKSPSLERLFIKGLDIGNPLKSRLVGDDPKEFNGKQHPTYFRIIPKDIRKNCHINMRFRAQFETDVVNDYFGRDAYPGKFSLYQNGKLTRDYILNLWNGTGTLTISLPEGTKIGDKLNYFAKVEDDTGVEFVNEFTCTVIEAFESAGGTSGKRRLPAGSSNGNRSVPDRLNLPQVTEVREYQWGDHGFDKFSALRVVNNEDGTYDYFINIDNVYLRAELKSLNRKKEPKLFESRFKFALVLIGLALLKDNLENLTEDDETPEDRVFSVTKSLAPIILPMIESLGDLKIEDVTVELEGEDISE